MSRFIGIGVVVGAVVAVFFCLALAVVPGVVHASLVTIFDLIIDFATVLFWAGIAMLIISIGYGILNGLEHYLMRRAERHKLEHEADTRVIDAPPGHMTWASRRNGEIANLTLDSRLLITPGAPPATSEEVERWAVWHALHAPGHSGNGGPALLGAPQPVDMLAFLRPVKRGLIVGPSDAGKTTLLKWLISERAPSSHVLVIDPHAGPATWPCEVIGRGSDHAAISRALDGFIALMVQRYREIGEGKVQEEGHERITIIVDEWMSIADQCGNAAYAFRRLLTEARKANIHLFLGSHSEMVEALGLRGRGNLRDGLVIAKLSYNQVTGERSAIIKIKYDDHVDTYPALLPGQFAGGDRWEVATPQPLELPRLEPSEEERRIITLHDAGKSLKQISEAIWGDGKFGGFYNDKIASALIRHGRG